MSNTKSVPLPPIQAPTQDQLNAAINLINAMWQGHLALPSNFPAAPGFAPPGSKIGQTINIRRPMLFNSAHSTLAMDCARYIAQYFGEMLNELGITVHRSYRKIDHVLNFQYINIIDETMSEPHVIEADLILDSAACRETAEFFVDSILRRIRGHGSLIALVPVRPRGGDLAESPIGVCVYVRVTGPGRYAATTAYRLQERGWLSFDAIRAADSITFTHEYV
jgi:hypothetical protein